MTGATFRKIREEVTMIHKLGCPRLQFWDAGEFEVSCTCPEEGTVYYSIQGDYGYGHGWEEVCAEDTLSEARKRRTEYEENEPGVPFRIRKVKA